MPEQRSEFEFLTPSAEPIHSSAPPLQFYIPHRGPRRDALPDNVEDYWPWLCRNRDLGDGRHTWTLQTYLYLKHCGISCRVVAKLPSRGLVLSHRDFLPIIVRPRPGVFLVCIKPDRKEHTWAQYYVVQNRADRIFSGRNRDNAQAILHWPQPALVPRRAERKAFVNLRYIGRSLNLAAELQTAEWEAWTTEAGCTWSHSVAIEDWGNYEDIDAIVAVRGFGAPEAADEVLDPDGKPPSKLVNAWHAGVPAIVGEESSFRSVRRSPLDFIEVHSLPELQDAVLRLKQDRPLYEAMVANGRERAREFSAGAALHQWIALYRDVLVPRYSQWLERGWTNRLGLQLRGTASYFRQPGSFSKIRISS